jgi:hypothetical protein
MTAALPCCATQDLARHLDRPCANFCETGYVFNEDLTFDLYGTVDFDQHTVETVMIAGTKQDVTTLLSRAQLGELGCWLDLRNSTTPVLREWAEIHKHRAAKPDWSAA